MTVIETSFISGFKIKRSLSIVYKENGFWVMVKGNSIFNTKHQTPNTNHFQVFVMSISPASVVQLPHDVFRKINSFLSSCHGGYKDYLNFMCTNQAYFADIKYQTVRYDINAILICLKIYLFLKEVSWILLNRWN
jgi:hypothetical protein